ncbi:MAG: sirohydrochlorin cobaltochelatase [Ruminiclostridium sp.]|nr:sirohydrochlorin cobaltochelatase [Ruminiclostridium sp.]
MTRTARTTAALLSAVCAISMAGCGNNAGTSGTSTAAETTSATAAAAENETESTTAAAEKSETETTTAAPETEAVTEKPEEDTAADKPVILMVSFGTSYNDSRDKTIGTIEEAVQAANPDYDVRRAFTSQIIIDKLKERDGLEIDNVDEAFARLEADGVKDLTVQPTHVMSGYEYDDLIEVVRANADKFDSVKVGAPLLTSDEDYTNVINAITVATSEYDDGETAIVFMGHGTEHSSNATYSRLQQKLIDAGKKPYCIGTVEAEPSIEDVVAFVKNFGYKRVILEPLMVVAGDHANNDMAGDEEDSWKTILTNEGFEVVPVLRGLGEIPAIRDIYVDHVKNAQPLGAEDTAASAGDTALADGTYSIDVDSSSSMFKIVKCELTVAGGEMTAVMTLSGTGYGKLFMGTVEEAANADESECIPFVEDAEGAYTYTIPVAALDTPIQCAAWSTKKSEWYDRELTFKSDSIS